MQLNKPLIVSIVLIMIGYLVLFMSINKTVDAIFGFVTAVGLIMFALSLFHILNKK